MSNRLDPREPNEAGNNGHAPLRELRPMLEDIQQEQRRGFQELRAMDNRLFQLTRQMSQLTTLEIPRIIRDELSFTASRRPSNIIAQSYDFFSGGRRYARWLLVEVLYDATSFIKAYENIDRLFVCVEDSFVNRHYDEDASPNVTWNRWHRQILREIQSKKAMVLTAVANWSNRQFQRRPPLGCGCPDTDEPRNFHHDDGTMCSVHQLSEKAVVVIYHELQSKEFNRLWSFQLDPSSI